jgi:ATPase subunit of ABC transporter with duplicated ATPase domains
MIADANREVSSSYVPQIIDEFDSLSGGERFNKSLSQALSKTPSMLLLDEPTNHLDLQNRKSLTRMLKSYYGTLIVVTHDKELLRNCVDVLWRIDNGKVEIFHGKYDDYMNEIRLKRHSVSRQIELLEREKKSTHKSLMKEQERTAKSRASGKRKIAIGRWMPCVGDIKTMKAEKSQGNKLKAIDEKKQRLSEELTETRLPETIIPKFYLSHRDIGERTIVSIVDGSFYYRYRERSETIRGKNNVPSPDRHNYAPLLSDIHFSLSTCGRIAIVGNNGSGKTTLVKAIMNDPSVVKSGEWNAPDQKDVGYLDQHYKNLDPEKSAFEVIAETNPSWNREEIRRLLNDFLFRKNEEVETLVKNLSGGEKARLSLAKIAANPPKLLILDEITNNIDLETRDHIVEILRDYPAAMIVISHDETFLEEIRVEKWNIK